MKIVFPNNIFAKALAASLPEDISSGIYYKESSLIVTELETGKADLAMLPSCDLLKREDLFISGKTALSLDGELSNSYFYFNTQQLDEIHLRGDICSNDVILSKILFKEKYDSVPQIVLDTKPEFIDGRNYLIAGGENFTASKYEKGLSFADELSALLFMPYVNYVISSKSENFIQEFEKHTHEIDAKIEDNLESFLAGADLEPSVKGFFLENFNNVYFEMTDVEKDGLVELLKMPYFHGIIEELHELKFA